MNNRILSVIPINAREGDSTKRPSCLCSEKKVSKVMLVIFILINLSMIACGGVVFTLGLTGYWPNSPHFAHLMVVKIKMIFRRLLLYEDSGLILPEPEPLC